MRLREFQRTLGAAEAALARFAGTIREAHAHRLLGTFYLLVPHNGMVRGGNYLRGEMEDGEYRESTAADKEQAIEHLEPVAARRASGAFRSTRRAARASRRWPGPARAPYRWARR